MLNAMKMQESIVFFDGICNLCNHFIDWLIRHDSRAVFKIASLQGEFAKLRLSSTHHEHLDSIVLLESGQIYTKSTAVLKILAKLGAPWSWTRVFIIVPRPIRDAAYSLIARNRYSLFGKRESCRL
ncbi:MAG: DUF393 domain-containing protein, partial [Bdellovibrionales bacterium]|nr:DUF393 domain-containing protein [Bdellovibrionales bacterium]